MFRSNTTRLRTWITSGLLLATSACTDTGETAVSPTFEPPGPKFNAGAVAGTDYGIASPDTSISVSQGLKLYFYQPTIIYQISGRNKIAVPTKYVSRNPAILEMGTVSGGYGNFIGKSVGSTYVIGWVWNKYDSIKVTVKAVTTTPTSPTPTSPTPTSPTPTSPTPTSPTPTSPTPTSPTPVTPSGSPTYVTPAAPATVPVAYPAMTGTSRKVNAGGDLQAALNAALPGDEIVLQNGATFTGNFTLPPKTGTAMIVVRSETVPVGAGTRMTPAAAVNAAKIVTASSDAAIKTTAGSANWRFVGLEVARKVGTPYNYGIIVLGRGDEKVLSTLPRNIVLDRMYIHGTTTDGTSRCVAFNGTMLAVIDSHLGECHAKGQDAQGVGGWNGPGPFLIENNRIEASGQGVMFGGADPVIANVSPSDITIRRNYIYKPMTWGNGVWTVKAAFELKHGKRVLFEGNVIENHWADAQVGFAILLQTLADNNTSWAWTTVQDIMIRNNLIKNATSGANVLSRVAYNGGPMPTNPTSRVVFLNNVFQNVGRDPIKGTGGIAFQLLSDLVDVSLVNNTVIQSQGANQAVFFDGLPTIRTTIVNNVFPVTSYGIFGSSRGSGNGAINFYAPGGVVVGNVLPGQPASTYPANNFFPSSILTVQITSLIGPNFSLASTSPYYTSLLGLVGVNSTTLNGLIGGVQ
jgi:hypothetical protein